MRPDCAVVDANGLSDREKCLLDALDSAGEATMVGEIRARYQRHEDTVETERKGDEMIRPVERRIAAEVEILDRPFAMTAHRPNCFLP
ncbi:MAG: hypothetical protein ACI909_003152 [Planctomycetota bacterium]